MNSLQRDHTRAIAHERLAEAGHRHLADALRRDRREARRATRPDVRPRWWERLLGPRVADWARRRNGDDAFGRKGFELGQTAPAQPAE